MTIDGRVQSGTDAVIFHRLLPKTETDVRVEGRDVTYTSKQGKTQTTLQIQNWDRWAPSDVYSSESLSSLVRLPNVTIGPKS